MIFRLKTAEGSREDLDEGIALFRDVVSQCCVDVEGFRAGYFLVDRKSGRMVTLTLWTDRTALKQGLRNVARRAKRDAAVAATIERVSTPGVRFDTFELAHEVAPRRALVRRSAAPARPSSSRAGGARPRAPRSAI